MLKRNVIKILLVCAVLFTVGALSAVSVSAEISKVSDIPSHTVGVVGSFNDWKDDVPLTDDDGDGLYEGIVTVDEVTEDMIVGWSVDDEPTGESYLQFKVRLDGEWEDSWGYYEPIYDRTWNSMSNVPVKEAVVGKSLKFKVYFDTKNPNPDSLENTYIYEEPVDKLYYLNVYYEIISIGDLIIPNTSDCTETYLFTVFLTVLSAGAIFFLKQRKFS